MLLTGFQERVVSKRRQVSIPLNVKSTAEGQTHSSARQPGLRGGRSKRQVISHTTAENSLHRQISRLGCYEREKAVWEAIGCFSTRKEVWGWVRATCKGTSWTESWGSGSNWGSVIVSKVCQSSVFCYESWDVYTVGPLERDPFLPSQSWGHDHHWNPSQETRATTHFHPTVWTIGFEVRK